MQALGGKLLSKGKFFGMALSVVLVVSGCTFFEPSARNARELKKLLDDRGVACEEFEVTVDEETQGELLTCKDGSAKNEGFYFVVWTSTEKRDEALKDFCFNIKRRANAQDEFIAASSWIGYSASTYIPTSLLAEELGQKVQNGESFCSERGLEVAEALSDEGVAIVKSIYVTYKDLQRVGIEKAEKYTLRFGSMMSGPELANLESRLDTDLFKLKKVPDLPSEILAKIEAIDPKAISKASRAFDNGTSPAYLFMSGFEGNSYEEKWDSMMPTINEHNRRVDLFNIAHSGAIINLASLLDTCAEFAPIEW